MAVLTCGDGGSNGQQIVAQINENTEAVAAQAIAIQANTDAINVVEADMIVVQNRLDGLDALNFYESNSTVDTLDISNVYTTVASLDVNILAGEYLIGLSDTHSFDTLNKGVYHQIIVNGGTPMEFIRESTDVGDIEAFDYNFPFTMAADGLFTIQVDIRKEDTAGALDCLAASVWIERKA